MNSRQLNMPYFRHADQSPLLHFALPRREQGADPPGAAAGCAQAAEPQQLRFNQPARGNEGGRHHAARVLPTLRRHGGAGPRPRRRVVRVAARHAARGTDRPEPHHQRHRRIN